MSIIEDDEEAQKRGVVCCAYCVGGGVDFDLKLIRNSYNLRIALPIRFDSVHVCYNDLRARTAMSVVMFSMAAHSRIRFRTHFGSDEECQCQLSSFGIPMSAFPVSPRGEFSLENHRTFMAIQRARVATQKAKEKPAEKARSRQPILKEDVFVAAPRPVVTAEPTGYGRLMSFNNVDYLPRPSFAIPWWNNAEAPDLPLVVHPEKELPVVPGAHIIGPTTVSRPPAKLYKSPVKPYVIYDPLPNDILFGRGKPIQQRPGNVRFREMIDNHIIGEKHDQGGNGGSKYSLTIYIVHLVKEEGGRFLKELEDGGWAEVEETAARAKVSHAFRTRRQVYHATLKKDKSTA